MARALIEALEQSGHEVELASRLRSFDRNGDAARQRRIEHLGAKVADRLIKRYNRPAHGAAANSLGHLSRLSQIA